MSAFFPMRRSERWFLILLVVLSIGSFLPWWRDILLAGISLSGLWMATLMLLSPVVALLIFIYERKRSGRQSQGSQ